MLLTGIIFSLLSCTSNNSEPLNVRVPFSRHRVGAFTIELPTTWKPLDVSATKAGQGVAGLYAFQPPCDTAASFCENVVIRLTTPTPEVSLTETGTLMEEAFREKFERYTLHSRRDTIIHQLPMVVLDYEFTTQNLRLRSTAVLVQSSGCMAQFGFTTINEPKATDANHQRLLHTIITSIRPE
nr:DcrB-related protein [Hymenobacter pini]